MLAEVTAPRLWLPSARACMYRDCMPLRRLLVAALVTLPVAAQSTLHLLPEPRSVTDIQDVALPHGIQVLCPGCDADDTFAADDLRQTLAERGIPTSGSSGYRITLRRLAGHPDPAFTAAMQPEGYTITPERNGLLLTGATAAGVFYAAQTAKQLITLGTPGSPAAGEYTLHAATIRDWPALKYRGLSDDLSRGPIDTLDFQKKLIRTLAAFKVNLYSPYFEAAQQYAANPLPAPPGGSISAADARELVAYARRFHILVVPDQEAFGHLRHVLTTEQYSALAETPHGAVLAPAQPGSLALIKQDFTELAALYPGPFLHIGADETEDLGVGQTKAAVTSRGLGPVYLDFLQQIDQTLRPLGRRLLFWGDIAENSPELLKGLPQSFKDNTVAISWHYNAPGPNGFQKYINDFKSAGFEFWVAPGINNWSRVYPNYNYALANIQVFTAEGQAAGADGQLNTVWYDDGEALASNNWFGILFGATAAWQPGTSSIPAFEASYGPVFHGDMTGKLDDAQHEIMAAHALLKSTKLGDGSDLLFWGDPYAPDYQKNVELIRPVLHELRLHAERALTLIAEARAAYPAAGCAGSILGTIGETPKPVVCNGVAIYPAGKPLQEGTLGAIPADPFPATSLREPDAIDAIELGARRLDFIGLKFQLADEMRSAYARAYTDSLSPDKATRKEVSRELYDINGVNGRIQDIKDGYSLLRDLYANLWLRTNRPYALRPVLEHYDYTVGLWLARMDKARTAQRTWEDQHTLPPAAQTGIPAPTQP